MANRLTALRLRLLQSLGFVPGLIVACFGVLAIVLVEADKTLDGAAVEWLFSGDEQAARTVLSVIAGSLITVAGLTFSITIVVLQLASSQFSPRILHTFFGDRLMQVTVGTLVGIFVYALFALRAVGSLAEDGGFVPRLSVTVAAALGIAAVVLLIAFLHHVSQMIQASHVTGLIGRQTLRRLERLYPDGYEEPVAAERADDLLDAWRADAPGLVLPARPGYVQRVALDELVESLDRPPERIAIRPRPGDFISVETPIAEVWPSADAERIEEVVAGAVTIASERDLRQDVDFGVRQLTDTAVKAMSPSVNDPTTAVTCIGYLRSILVRLAGRSFPEPVRRFPGLTVIAAVRGFEEFLDPLAEIGRYTAGDARVAGALLGALRAVAETAAGAGAADRARAARSMAATIAGQAAGEAKSERDRSAIEHLLAGVEADADARRA